MPRTSVVTVLDAPLARRPGEIMIYSNHTYELLSEIVRRVTGRPHWEIAQERIFYIVPESEAGRVVGATSRLGRRCARPPAQPRHRLAPDAGDSLRWRRCVRDTA